ncbi:MAG: hypothetical protein ACRDK8_00860 [Solirubrobacteraceae bacterium]
MHTSRELRAGSFQIELAGEPATIDQLLPGFDAADRLGIVVREPCAAVGASCLLLSAVTAFYDAQRARSPEFFIYPDYFLLHVERPLGDHSMLDVWPSHKEVVVADDAEALLEAINDRGVTWLAVPDGTPAPPTLSPESLASARDRIRGAFAYSPAGHVTNADVRITGDEVTESYVHAVLAPEQLVATPGDAADPYAASVARRADEVSREERERLWALRERLRGAAGRPVESYRRLTLDRALELLAPARSNVAAAPAA